jgi:hypothetical protein
MINSKLSKLLGFGLISLITLSACGTDNGLLNNASNETVQIAGFQNNSLNVSSVVESLINNASKLGVRLNNGQLEEISMQRHARPSGFWAARPALNLSSEQNLNTHFLKHRKEFYAINSPEQYLKRAIEFQLRQTPTVFYFFDVTSFDKGYQSNVIKYDTSTGEFGAMKANGDITTYYTSDMPSPKRFIPVPIEFSI